MGKNITPGFDKFMIAQYPGLPTVLVVRLSRDPNTQELEALIENAELLAQHLVRFVFIDSRDFQSISLMDVTLHKSKLRELFENVTTGIINLPKDSIADMKMGRKFLQIFNIEVMPSGAKQEEALADIQTREPKLALIMQEYLKGTEPTVLVDLLI